MCLIAVASGVPGPYQLVVAANRDERHARPTAQAAWWPDGRAILGGRDLVAGGSWLAIDARGRLAAVTNVFEPGASAAPRSRGALVADFLAADQPAREFAASLTPTAESYGPFNLLLCDDHGLEYSSNRAPASTLGPGIHAFSNAGPAAAWPKVESARAGLAELLAAGAGTERRAASASIERLLAWLGGNEESAAADPRARRFVRGAEFGTRCSTVVLVGHDGKIVFVERSFNAAGSAVGEVRYEFELAAASGINGAGP